MARSFAEGLEIADPAWLVGIEIGGTKLQLGLARRSEPGRLIQLDRLAIIPAGGASGILKQIQNCFETMLARARIDCAQIAAVGVGFGGPVDAAAGLTRKSYQVEGWSDFPLSSWLCENLSIPKAAIENDADAAGLAEAHYGAGIGFSPILYLTIGSGIGGALILDGRIYRGTGVGAVEIGHLEVPDPACTDGRTIELEHVASGWGISERACRVARIILEGSEENWEILNMVDGEPTRITAVLVAQAAIRGDERANRILDDARRALAYGLRQAITLLAPRRIILGGGVSLLGEAQWFKPLRGLVSAQILPLFRDTYDIVPAALGEDVVVHGAIALADKAILGHS